MAGVPTARLRGGSAESSGQYERRYGLASLRRYVTLELKAFIVYGKAVSDRSSSRCKEGEGGHRRRPRQPVCATCQDLRQRGAFPGRESERLHHVARLLRGAMDGVF